MSRLVIFYSVFKQTRTCVALDHAQAQGQEISDAKNALQMFCRGPEKSVALAGMDLRASWLVAFSLCECECFLLGFEGMPWLLVGLLSKHPPISPLPRSTNNTKQASSPALRPAPSQAPALTLAETAEADAWCGCFFRLAILHPITPSNHHPPSHTTQQHQHGRNL